MAMTEIAEDGPDLRAAPRMCVAIPCHNEAATLPALFARLEALSDALLAQSLIAAPFEVILIDDGSLDETWAGISQPQTHLPVRAIKLSRNYGHQAALFAGLMHVEADVVVSMDADLQDDPDAVIPMVKAYLDGAEVVFGVRASRAADTAFKRNSARLYYHILRKLGVDLIPDHADFRLMSQKALRALSSFGETNLFLRGLVRQVGFKTQIVTYDRAERVAGESSYTLRRMISLALEGVTSFSVRPLRLIAIFGFAVAAIAFLFSLYSVVVYASGQTVPGWTSVVLPLSLLGGAHLIALGVIGEYIGKIYQEIKARPRFIVDEVVLTNSTDQHVSVQQDRATGNRA